MSPLTWSLILLAAGLLLVFLEMFIPSGGLLGTLAGVSVVAAVVVAFRAGNAWGLTVLLTALVLVPTSIGLAVRWWPNTPLGRLILIPRPQHQDDVLPEEHRSRQLLVGKHGLTKSKMMPSGAITIDGVSYNAVTQGMPLEAGTPVEVVAVRTNSIVVKPLPAAPIPSPKPGTAAASPEPESLLEQPLEEFELDSLDEPLG